MKKNMTLYELKEKGYKALAQSLGADGMIRFLQEFNNSEDDYSKTRHKEIDSLSVDDIYKAIKSK